MVGLKINDLSSRVHAVHFGKTQSPLLVLDVLQKVAEMPHFPKQIAKIMSDLWETLNINGVAPRASAEIMALTGLLIGNGTIPIELTDEECDNRAAADKE